jgi:fibro-slime domain-containing protein
MTFKSGIFSGHGGGIFVKKIYAVVCALACVVQVASPQPDPPTVTVPVTYFDFHSDGSNPDFNPGTNPAIILPGMVQPTLDANGLPVGTTTYLYSWGIGKWFRPWKQSILGQGSDAAWPSYGNNGRNLTGVNTVVFDTSYKNVVIQDSLVFVYVAGSPGAYQYQNANFFPLDGRGFGADIPTMSFNGLPVDRATNTHNYSFTMHLKRPFQFKQGLTFNFEGDDDMWVFVNGKLVLDLGGIHNTTQAQFALDGLTSQLGLVAGDSAVLDVFYCERQAIGSDIKITTNIVAASPTKLVLTMVPTIDTVPAGSAIVFNAAVVDEMARIRHEYDSQISWSLVPGGTASRISTVSGAVDTFFPVQAYGSSIVSAAFTDPVSQKSISVADTVFVKPGPGYRVWIEPDTNINANDRTAATLARLRNPDHVALVTFSDTQSQATLDAVVRDRFGNFTGFAASATWGESGANLGIVSVAASTPSYVGLVRRIPGVSGTTQVKALQAGLNFDTTTVNILAGYIKQIRIVNVATGLPITGISINTDQDITVKLQGSLSSDPSNTWVDITGAWSLSPNIASASPIPFGNSGSWTFSPTVPGGPSLLAATAGSGSHVVTIQIPVTVTADAGPTTMTFSWLAAPAARIAGDTILAAVAIFNKDGPVPGVTCLSKSLSCRDTIGKGSGPDPTITTGRGTAIITAASGANAADECFTNGLDTIKIVLFRAPFTDISAGAVDTLHQLFLNINGMAVTSGPFKLLPASLYSLRLENAAGAHLWGIDTMVYPDGHVTIYSVGYDRFGNKRGRELSNWSVNQTLHPLMQDSGISQVYYDASNAAFDESGLIIARAARFNNGVLSDSLAADSVGMFIRGKTNAVNSAQSRHVPPRLRVLIPNAGIHVFGLPRDVALSRISFELYSMSGKVVCKMEAINAEKPVDLNFSLQPGIYLVNIRASERQIVKSRFVIVK